MDNDFDFVPAYEGATFSIPENDAAGAPLSAEAQRSQLIKNVPGFAEKVSTQPHSPEAKLFARLNERAALEAEEADEAPPLEPPMKAARPGEYRLPYPPGTDASEGDLAEADLAIRGWLQAARLDAETGSALAGLIDERSRFWSKESDWPAASEKAISDLQKVWGKDFDRKLGKARALVADVERQRPGLVESLERSGVSNDALVIAYLAGIAERQGY